MSLSRMYVMFIVALLFGCAAANPPASHEMTKYVDTTGQSRDQLINTMKQRFEGKCTATVIGSCMHMVKNITNNGFDYIDPSSIDKNTRKLMLLGRFRFDTPPIYRATRGVTNPSYSVGNENCRVRFDDKEESLEFYGLLESIYHSGK